MAEGVGCRGGGIAGLLELLREHGEAVEYDLLALGLRLDWLGTDLLTWRDLLVVVRQAAPGSAIARAVEPEQAAWGLSEQLLALVADYLAWMQWAQSEDGEKRRNRPKPIPRPGFEPDEEQRVIGSDPVALEELDAFLGWAAERVQQQKPTRPRDARGRFVKVNE